MTQNLSVKYIYPLKTMKVK